MKQIRILTIPILLLVYIPHLLIMLFSKNREIIKEDINILKEQYSINLSTLCCFLYFIHYDRYFFTLFNNRVKDNKFRHLLYRRNSAQFFIPDDVTIGKGMRYHHPYSTILNAKYIGSNFSCKHLTTIGNKNDDEKLRPVILDNVSLGAGVIIVGDVVIGNNVVVGAGSVVVKSVPDNCTVVGNPGKIIKK